MNEAIWNDLEQESRLILELIKKSNDQAEINALLKQMDELNKRKALYVKRSASIYARCKCA